MSQSPLFLRLTDLNNSATADHKDFKLELVIVVVYISVFVKKKVQNLDQEESYGTLKSPFLRVLILAVKHVRWRMVDGLGFFRLFLELGCMRDRAC